MKIAVMIGTRPEIIKTWSVIHEINQREDASLILIHTGQHYDYEMSEAFFEDLSLEQPHHHLAVGSLPAVEQTTEIANRLASLLQEENADILLVQGDTNSCLGSAIAATLSGVPLGHIEAGCRSFDRTMPEEINRVVIDSVSNLLFAPSEIAYHNLLREGCDPRRVFLVGNTALDALNEGLNLLGDRTIDIETPYCVATIHRAGNTDQKDRLAEILKGLSQLPVRCIFPIHPRTQKMIDEFDLSHLVEKKNVDLVTPMGYLSFLNLMRHSDLVVTDSGGVQEEAALLGKPTLTIRNNTEWPETIWGGLNRLVSADSQKIKQEAYHVLKMEDTSHKPLYEGEAGKRIINSILASFNSGNLHYKSSNQAIKGYPMLSLKTKPEGLVVMSFDGDGKFVPTEDGNHYLVEEYVKLSPGGLGYK
ncbi:MAG: non-hydrolyzing UDP-N-acetylglucosamine 2-epimerase [Candidatus Sifarchaeia archaeon]